MKGIEHLTAEELAKKSRVSTTTIWRMKLAGQIPYYQCGKYSRVTFPADALESIKTSPACTQEELADNTTQPEIQNRRHLPGPLPDWMKNAE